MSVMGILPATKHTTRRFKRQHQWLFTVDGFIGGNSATIAVNAQRPSITLSDSYVNHVSEKIYYPTRAEFDPLNLTIIDMDPDNLIYDWLKLHFDAQNGTFSYFDGNNKKRGRLEMLDGCGQLMETWVYEGLWPQQVQFGDLDYSSSGIVQISVSLRFDRAYRA